uniref:Uncharacterized protein n=1 Tax=Oryza sativa subsp. japonica TaxID=39947 RepID=Q654Z1_ORYSJ|nr:hypothetical protein [Oryza sativa Japonica Group]BAD54503.1 hypothetical protein [Oryza sativa Japonica Group]
MPEREGATVDAEPPPPSHGCRAAGCSLPTGSGGGGRRDTGQPPPHLLDPAEGRAPPATIEPSRGPMTRERRRERRDTARESTAAAGRRRRERAVLRCHRP